MPKNRLLIIISISAFLFLLGDLILIYIYFNKLPFLLQKQEAAKTFRTADILNQDWDQLSHCMNSYFKAAWVKQILLDLLLFGSYAIWEMNIVMLEIFSKIVRSKIKVCVLFVHSTNQNHLIQELVSRWKQSSDTSTYWSCSLTLNRVWYFCFLHRINVFPAVIPSLWNHDWLVSNTH